MAVVLGSSRVRLAVTVSTFSLCAALGAQAAFGPPAVSQETEQAQESTADAALPDDVAGLIEEVSKVAREVSAKNEEVKELEDELQAKEEELVNLEAQAQDAQAAADEAEKLLQAQQSNVDGIAQSRYRGDTLDPFIATLNSGDPTSAVERLGYLGAISRDAQRSLNSIAEISDAVEESRAQADDAVAQAKKIKSELEKERDAVVADRADLEQRQQEIEDRVDSLSPDLRAAWENQNGPITDIDLADLGANATGAVAAALSKQGSPYSWGATGPSAFDCSGLMAWAYQQQGKSIPRTSQAQIAGGQSVSINDLQPGDIVGYYPGVTHVGMYIGNGQIVHASTYGVPVQVVPVDSMPITGASRY